ncbi:MAG: amino acid permease [Armatimonadetes bacterium RBG_16_58_9]|nr:MAG: amino acid permease [Armatimonadetes bacterium RBG_16_58_9]
MFGRIRRVLLGAPLPTSRQKHERLPKFLALPVFASDALSSNAYATEEILLALAVVGSAAWYTSLPIAASIVILLWIVVISYRLTIHAYPQGGGSYIVTKENLGVLPGLVAAASLLTDYVLTVAVSIAAGVAAVVSAYPSLEDNKPELGVVFIAVVALANLRGLRESGSLFAVPTYFFVGSIATMIVTGLFKVFSGAPIHTVNPAHFQHDVMGPISLVLILRAFAGGCAAMTGTEAVADGIPAFKPPESKNAAATLIYMAAILSFLFLGITYLARVYHALPWEYVVEHINPKAGYETVVSQIARGIYGRGLFYFAIQFATATILILAANTAYQDFPRLSSILARDRFAPRQLASIGDKLVFTNGIIALSLFAALLIVVFHGEVHALIPLYAVGVFISFTLSQFSMSLRQRRLKQPGWRFYSGVSLFGSIVTGIVAVVIAQAKFIHGAWIVLTLIPILVIIFRKINQHYMEMGDQLQIKQGRPPRPVRTTAIVLTAGIHAGVLPALEYARTLSHDCRALYIEIDPNDTPLIRDRWEAFGFGIPLVILESPYRSVLGPVLDYVEEAKRERPNHIVTVVVPEFVSRKWWHSLLHNQSALILKIALMLKRDIVVTNVRYYLEK